MDKIIRGKQFLSETAKSHPQPRGLVGRERLLCCVWAQVPLRFACRLETLTTLCLGLLLLRQRGRGHVVLMGAEEGHHPGQEPPGCCRRQAAGQPCSHRLAGAEHRCLAGRVAACLPHVATFFMLLPLLPLLLLSQKKDMKKGDSQALLLSLGASWLDVSAEVAPSRSCLGDRVLQRSRPEPTNGILLVVRARQ